MAQRAIQNALHGTPDMTADSRVQERKWELIAEAGVALEAIRRLADDSVIDAFTDPPTLVRAVRTGILDAPHLRNNPFARGRVMTRIINGQCLAVDANGSPLPERQRLAQLF